MIDYHFVHSAHEFRTASYGGGETSSMTLSKMLTISTWHWQRPKPKPMLIYLSKHIYGAQSSTTCDTSNKFAARRTCGPIDIECCCLVLFFFITACVYIIPPTNWIGERDCERKYGKKVTREIIVWNHSQHIGFQVSAMPIAMFWLSCMSVHGNCVCFRAHGQRRSTFLYFLFSFHFNFVFPLDSASLASPHHAWVRSSGQRTMKFKLIHLIVSTSTVSMLVVLMWCVRRFVCPIRRNAVLSK